MKVSDCCGASPKMIGDYDCDTEDFGLCPVCHDHCEYVEEEVIDRKAEGEAEIRRIEDSDIRGINRQ